MFNHISIPVLWFLFGYPILGATQTLPKEDPFAETVGLAIESSSQDAADMIIGKLDYHKPQ